MKTISQLRSRLTTYSMSLIDELTQLYNREGFICAGEELLDISGARERWAFLLFLKVEHLKFINHSLGRAVGDSLLVRTTILLRDAFRKAAVIGRLGTDEFAVLGRVASPSDCAAALAYLDEAIDADNSLAHGLNLSVSGGFSQFDLRYPVSITERLMQADTAMKLQQSQQSIPRRAIYDESSSSSRP
jgi:diguanylate cyclase (GGDEF)-like protein